MFCINIYMNYLISSFDCCLFDGVANKILRGAKYKILEDDKNLMVVFSKSQYLPFVFNLNFKCDNILQLTYKSDNYYILFPTVLNDISFNQFKFKNQDVSVSLFKTLTVSIDGECISEENVENIKFSHYEIEGDLCLIYFCGKRNYLIVLKNREIIFSNYYDECNIGENEKYFMCKLKDCLNHGVVCEIKDKNCLTYLVYLDNEEMNLKKEFVANVFLDCVLAGNKTYCKNLMCEELKSCDNINEFFPEFDFYFQLEENIFALTKKNTLAGIFQFEITNKLIANIIPLH